MARAVAWAIAVVGFCPLPGVLAAQPGEGVPIWVVETWIQGNVSAERQWNREISKTGIAFVVDADVEARLRGLGAGDEWIAVLRRARVTPPLGERGSPTRRPLSRGQLRPLYFGNEARIAPYVGLVRLRESGGQVTGQTLRTAQGSVPLKSASLDRSLIAYGLTVDYRSVGLDIEGAFQHDLLMLNLGMKYSPFLPVGASGVRVLLGVKPFVGITRQTLAHLPPQASDTGEPVVDLLNTTYGGDVSAGLAYHWRPGAWVFTELHYRVTSTLSRELRAPGQANITDGIPWSKWAASGPMLRIGVGF